MLKRKMCLNSQLVGCVLYNHIDRLADISKLYPALFIILIQNYAILCERTYIWPHKKCHWTLETNLSL